MEEFIALNEAFDIDINSSKMLLTSIQEQYEKGKRLKYIIDNIYDEQTKELDGKLKKEARRMFPELSVTISKIESLCGYMDFIHQRRYSLLPEKEIRRDLTDAGVSLNDINGWFSLLDPCKLLEKKAKTSKEISGEINDVLKNVNRLLLSKIVPYYNELVEELIDSLKKKLISINNGDLEAIGVMIENTKNKIEVLEKIRSHFDTNGLIKLFDNDEEKAQFYEWMNGKIKPEIIEKIIKIVEAGKLSKELEDNEDNKKIITFDNLDLSEFTEDEQLVIKEISELYKKLKERVSLRKANNNHEIYYITNNKYNWAMILADIDDKLLPSIYENKEIVISAFRDIIKLVSQRDMEIENGLDFLDSCLKQLKSAMRYADKYDSKYDYLIDDNYSKDSEMFSFHVSYEYVDMCYYLKHTVDSFIWELLSYRKVYQNCLDRDLGLLDNMRFNEDLLKSKFDKIMQEANDKITAYQRIEQGKFRSDNDDNEQYERSANLVFCIEDIELPSEGHRRELNETLKDFARKSHKQLKKSGNSRRDQLATIKRAKETKGDRVIEYNDPCVKPYCKFFLPYRYAGQADYRTGLIHFNRVHPEIKKKIRERYNLSNQCGIYGVFMVISAPGANHSEYVNLEDYIKDHMEELDQLGEMFNNPNTDIDMLFRIIDDGIKKRDELRGEKNY